MFSHLFRCMLLALCLFSSCGKRASQPSQVKVTEGVEYQQMQKNTAPKWSAHVLRVNPSKVSIQPVKALPGCLGRETVSAIANRYNALAAVNGGFFEENGTPAGVLKIWDYWFSDPKRMRGTIGWNHGSCDAHIDRLGMQWVVEMNGQHWPVHRVNHIRGKKRAIVYNPAFGASTKTNRHGTEIIIEHDHVVDIQHGVGNATIPFNGFVYSIAKDADIDLSLVKTGMFAALHYSCQTPSSNDQKVAWEEFDFIVGGTPVLVSQGQVNPDFDADNILHSFIHNRYARTAVGIMPDGTWIVVVVDGKASPISEGMTIQELADFMHRLGCVKALNLDGGSSSTMWVKGKVVNTPGAHWWIFSLPGEPKVSDALVVMPR